MGYEITEEHKSVSQLILVARILIVLVYDRKSQTKLVDRLNPNQSQKIHLCWLMRSKKNESNIWCFNPIFYPNRFSYMRKRNTVSAYLGPVCRKSRNFSGLFRMPQFPLYHRNVEVLSHQTSQLSFFLWPQKHVKRPAFQNKQIEV